MAAPLYAARPPSAWVRDKGPDHDRYQGWLMQVLRQGRGGMHPSFLARGIRPEAWTAYRLRQNTSEYRLEAEFEFLRDGFVFAFADILEQRLSTTGTRTVTIWEIKPKIESVFGTIRQIKYYRHLAQERFPEADHIRFVVACCRDDPLAGLMRREWKNTVPLSWGWTPPVRPIDAGEYEPYARVSYLTDWALQKQYHRDFPAEVVAGMAGSLIAAVFRRIANERTQPKVLQKALQLLLDRPEICRWFSDPECLAAARAAWWTCFGAPLRHKRAHD